MWIVEFKKEAHDENMKLVHRIKEDICELFKRLEGGAHGERHYEIDAYDERKNRNSMEQYYRRDGMMDERRGGGMGRKDDRFEDRRYPQYPFDERGGGRYNY